MCNDCKELSELAVPLFNLFSVNDREKITEKVLNNYELIFFQIVFAENVSAKNRTVGEFLNKQIEIINNATSELIAHGKIRISEKFFLDIAQKNL